MSPEQIAARLTEIRDRLTELDKEFEGQVMPDAERGEFKTLIDERKELDKLDEELRVRRELIAEQADKPNSREAGFNVPKQRVRGEDIYDLSTVRASVSNPSEAANEMRDRAKRAIEAGHFASKTISREEAQTNAERLLDHVDDAQGSLARRFLETGSPTYARAFGKYLAGQPLNDSEQRALSTTGAGGGYAIPFTLDPTVIHTSSHSVNPWRAISRVVQVTTNNWHGVSSAGVSASYAGEAAEVADGTPTLVQPSIQVEKAHAFVPFSIEIGEDWSGLQMEITSMIQDGKDDLEATKFAFGAGHGSTEPKGVLIGGTATLTTAAGTAVAVADIYATETALPPRHRPNAQWVANRAIYNRVRQFDTSGGAQLWTENLQRGLANNGPTPGNTGYNLLGYPTNECSTMGTSILTGGTIAVFGDFSKFVIVDRIGMNVEVIPHLFATANNLPSGSRGIYAYWRNSSDVTDPLAFRKLLGL